VKTFLEKSQIEKYDSRRGIGYQVRRRLLRIDSGKKKSTYHGWILNTGAKTFQFFNFWRSLLYDSILESEKR
jgi:hypothetical protein